MDKEKAIERLMSKRSINEITGCWIWTGAVMPYNYGTTILDGVTWVTHRLAYTIWVGPIPTGALCRHKCDNPRCFNPDHLRTGTHTENNMDCVLAGRHANSSKTHCKRGHEFTPDNTKILNAMGHRMCIACSKLAGKKKYQPARKDYLTHCKRGHPRSAENTYQEPNGGKKCRICMRQRLNRRRSAILKLMKDHPEQVTYRAESSPLPSE